MWNSRWLYCLWNFYPQIFIYRDTSQRRTSKIKLSKYFSSCYSCNTRPLKITMHAVYICHYTSVRYTWLCVFVCVCMCMWLCMFVTNFNLLYMVLLKTMVLAVDIMKGNSLTNKAFHEYLLREKNGTLHQVFISQKMHLRGSTCISKHFSYKGGWLGESVMKD